MSLWPIITEKNLKLFYGASYRHLPAICTARDIIQQGVIGKVLHISESLIGGMGSDAYQALSDVHYPEGGPGGSLMGLVDHGIHLIDAFAFLLNDKVESVFGQGNIAGKAPSFEYALMNFAGGAAGSLSYLDTTVATVLPQEGAFGWGGTWDIEVYIPPGPKIIKSDFSISSKTFGFTFG